MQPRLTFNSRSSCPSLPSAGLQACAPTLYLFVVRHVELAWAHRYHSPSVHYGKGQRKNTDWRENAKIHCVPFSASTWRFLERFPSQVTATPCFLFSLLLMLRGPGTKGVFCCYGPLSISLALITCVPKPKPGLPPFSGIAVTYLALMQSLINLLINTPPLYLSSRVTVVLRLLSTGSQFYSKAKPTTIS